MRRLSYLKVNKKQYERLLAPFLTWHGWSFPLFSLILSATLVIPFWKNIEIRTDYPEFVVGLISWGDKGKTVDFFAFYLFIGLALAMYAAFQVIIFMLPGPECRAAEIVKHLFWLASLPLAFWLGSVLVDPEEFGLPLEWTLAAGSLIVFLIWGIRAELNPARLSRAGTLILLISFLSLFCGFALILVLGLVFGTPWSQKIIDTWVWGTVGAGLLPPFLILFLSKKNTTALIHFLHRYILFLQVPLPLLFLSIMPLRLIYKGELQSFRQDFLLLSVMALGVICAWYFLYRQGKKSWNRKAVDLPLSSYFSAPCLMGIAIFIAVRSLNIPPFYADDFHLGEQLLPWQQMVDFQKIPFVDFAPVHGVMPLMTGFFNWCFYDGTLANFVNATKMLQALGAGITFLTIYFLAGVPVALFCSLLLPSQFFGFAFDRLLFLSPAIFILAFPSLFEKRKRWLITWFVLSSCMAFYNPSVGAAFALSTVPFAVWQGLRFYRADRRGFLFLAAGMMTVVLLILGIPLSRAIISGYLLFIIENAATNSFANAIPAAMSVGKTPFVDGLLSNFLIFEVFRFSWVFFIVLAIFLSLHILSNYRGRFSGAHVFLVICPAIILIVLSAWSLCRIDPGASRTGLVSFVVFGQILPVALAVAYKGIKVQVFVILAFLGGIFSALFYSQDHFSARMLGKKALGVTIAPANIAKVDGSTEGMPNLGLIFADSVRLNEVKEFKDALSQVISEEQTYFDLTNKQAQYFFLNKPVPALYAASYVAVNRDQQRRILNQLGMNPPAAVLIHPSLNFDGFSSSLRSFYLYRDIVQNYDPVKVGKYVFMVNELSKAYPLAATGSEKRQILSEVFSHPNLQALPLAWGGSWLSLQEQAKLVKELEPISFSKLQAIESLGEGIFRTRRYPFDETFYLQNNPDVAAAVTSGKVISGLAHYQMFGQGEGRSPSGDNLMEFDLEAFGFAGSDIDLVVIGIDLLDETGISKEMSFQWEADDGRIASPIRMKIANNYLVIPVSSFPEWLLSNRINKIKFIFPDNFVIRIRNISFWLTEYSVYSD